MLRVDLSDTLFPLRLPLGSAICKPIGWLLLGPRPDGTLYGKDERDALGSILSVIGQALARAMGSEAIHRSNLRAMKRTRKELDDLQQRVLAIEAWPLVMTRRSTS